MCILFGVMIQEDADCELFLISVNVGGSVRRQKEMQVINFLQDLLKKWKFSLSRWCCEWIFRRHLDEVVNYFKKKILGFRCHDSISRLEDNVMVESTPSADVYVYDWISDFSLKTCLIVLEAREHTARLNNCKCLY